MASSSISNTATDQNQQKLDVILTTIESKLRNTYSFIEFKSNDESATSEELKNICLIWPRMTKIVKMRVLIGFFLLNVHANSNMDEVKHLLESAVEDDDEWVRVLAETVRKKVLLQEGSDNCNEENVIRLIRATSEQIINNVLDAIDGNDDDDDQGGDEAGDDSNTNEGEKKYNYVDPEPLLAPNYFAWVEHDTTKDDYTQSNTHFQVNAKASILQVDTTLESKRAADAEEVNSPTSNATSNDGNDKGKSGKSMKKNNMSTSTTNHRTSFAAASTSSSKATLLKGQSKAAKAMAIPVKRYGTAAAAPRKSKIKEILGNKRKQQMQGSSARSLSSIAIAGSNKGIGMRQSMGRLKREDAHRTSAHRAAGKFSSRYQGAGSSKMKMIDINEVKDLNVKQQEQNNEETMTKINSKKRRLQVKATTGEHDGTSVPDNGKNDNGRKGEFGAPTIKVNVKRSRIESSREEQHNGNQGENENVSQEQHESPAGAGVNNMNMTSHIDVTSIAAPPTQQHNIPPTDTAPAPAPVHVQAPPQEQLDWHQLLEKSNKITPADRARVEQFFTTQYNPTPGENVYKMKLHEEKTMQPDGGTVKETLYLELDYTTFGFKKLRKIKKK